MNNNQTMMKRSTGGYALVQALKTEGVDTVFGLIGSSTMEIFDALYDEKDIKYIGVRDERTGTHMADAFSRSRGRSGVIIAGQNGPGATNLVTGIAQAYQANSPLVAIAGSIATNHKDKDAFQEIDQQSIFSPITKKTFTVDRVDRIPEIVQAAFRLSQAGKKGPVLINIPRDVLSEEADFPVNTKKEDYRIESSPAGNQQQIERAVELLKNSKQPLIIAGAGVKDSKAHKEVIELAEKLQSPIATSAGHGDAIPSDNDYFAGQTGPRGNNVATTLANEADVILVLGSRLGFNSTFYSYDNLNEDAKIIQVNIDHSALSRYFPIELGIVGDAKVVTLQILQQIKEESLSKESSIWLNDFQNARQELLKERKNRGTEIKSSVIQPFHIFEIINGNAPRNTMFTLDAGTLCLQATDVLNYYEPRSLFTPLDFGLVGFSFAAGLGLKLSSEDRMVISLMGDGGFGMTLSELTTAVDYKLNTLTIVMNNHSWGAEKAYQRDFFDERYLGADIINPRYDKVAELYGAKGFYVSSPSQLEEVIKKAIKATQDGHTVIVDAQVDPDALYSFRKDSFKNRKK